MRNDDRGSSDADIYSEQWQLQYHHAQLSMSASRISPTTALEF
jgi:hypothetical protein